MGRGLLHLGRGLAPSRSVRHLHREIAWAFLRVSFPFAFPLLFVAQALPGRVPMMASVIIWAVDFPRSPARFYCSPGKKGMRVPTLGRDSVSSGELEWWDELGRQTVLLACGTE